MKLRNKELHSAATLVRQSMLSQYVSSEEHTPFSTGFTQRILSLDQLAHRRATFVQARRTIAAVILLLLFCSGIFVTTSPRARASVREWVREIYEHSIVYRFTTSNVASALPDVHFTWLPEGMEQVEVIDTESMRIQIYQDSNGYGFIFDESFTDSFDLLALDNPSGAVVEEEIRIRGQTAIFSPIDEAGTSNLIWIENGVIFGINGNLEKQDMLHIAESLILVKTEK